MTDICSGSSSKLSGCRSAAGAIGTSVSACREGCAHCGGDARILHPIRRLEREARHNVELMWLTGRLAPDFRRIARFRKDNGKVIRSACHQFVMLS